MVQGGAWRRHVMMCYTVAPHTMNQRPLGENREAPDPDSAKTRPRSFFCHPPGVAYGHAIQGSSPVSLGDPPHPRSRVRAAVPAGGAVSALDRPTDVALILGASARLTRFITVDDLGQWWIREPLHRRFVNTSAEKYLIGLHCPHCAGFHASLVVIATYALARLLHLLPVWRVVAGALAVNYVTAHVSERLDWEDDEGDRAEPSALKERDSS